MALTPIQYVSLFFLIIAVLMRFIFGFKKKYLFVSNCDYAVKKLKKRQICTVFFTDFFVYF